MSTTARLIDQRARRRATQALIEAHRDEFRTLYEDHRRAAEVEAAELAAKSAHPTPRLMPGARLPGQTSADRIDVARCALCVSSHDRGHACPKCGAAPRLDFGAAWREVHRLASAGTRPDIIAMTLHMPPEQVAQMLESREGTA